MKRSLLLAALLAATSSTAFAEQIGSRQTLEANISASPQWMITPYLDTKRPQVDAPPQGENTVRLGDCAVLIRGTGGFENFSLAGGGKVTLAGGGKVTLTISPDGVCSVYFEARSAMSDTENN